MVHHGKITKSKRSKQSTSRSNRKTPTSGLNIEGYRSALLLFFAFFLLMYFPRLIDQGFEAFNYSYSLAWNLDAENSGSQKEVIFPSDSLADHIHSNSDASKGKNKPGIGASLTAMPLLFLTRLLDYVNSWLGSKHAFSVIHLAAIGYTLVTVMLGGLSLLLIIASCRHFGSLFASQVAVMAVVFTSSFLSTTFIFPGSAETIGLFWFSLALYFLLERYFGVSSVRKSTLLLMGLSLGLAISTEWSMLAMIVVCLLLPGRGKSLFRTLRELQLVLVFFLLGLLIGLSPQLISAKLLYGTYINYSFSGDMSHVVKSIFHPRIGLIFQFPLVVFSFIGIIKFLRFDKRLSFLLLFMLFINVVIDGLKLNTNSFEFGHHHLVMMLPVLAIGLTFYLDRLLHRSRITPVMSLVLTGSLIFWTLLQMSAVLTIGNTKIISMSNFSYYKILFIEMFHNIYFLFSHSFFVILSPSVSGSWFISLEIGLMALFIIAFLLIIEWLFVKQRLGKIGHILIWCTLVFILIMDLIIIVRMS